LKIVDYFGEPFSFPHDLAFSVINKKEISVVVAPILLLLRFVIALFIPKLSEINTYIIKNQ
jgi:hypothetical protein